MLVARREGSEEPGNTSATASRSSVGKMERWSTAVVVTNTSLVSSGGSSTGKDADAGIHPGTLSLKSVVMAVEGVLEQDILAADERMK